MIDIKTFAVKKAAAKTSQYVYYGSSGGGFGNNTSSNVAGKIEGHYLWGQFFDGTQDIEEVSGYISPKNKWRTIECQREKILTQF